MVDCWHSTLKALSRPLQKTLQYQSYVQGCRRVWVLRMLWLRDRTCEKRGVVRRRKGERGVGW
jgi:hypothetical protein